MKVSLIIPTYNRALYIEEALKSCLYQDYSNIEIIISDNASTDNTYQIIKPYIKDNRVKYYRNNINIGMVANWRKAVYDYSEGDFFVIVSDDDYFIDNNYISKAIDLIKNNSNIVMVYSNGYILDELKNIRSEIKLPFKEIESGKVIFLSRSKVLPQDFTLCNVLFNRKITLSENSFMDDNDICCDTELFLRSCFHGNVGIINSFSSVYRVHDNNLINKLISNDVYFYSHLKSLIKILSDTPYDFLDEYENTITNNGVIKLVFILILLSTKNKKLFFSKIFFFCFFNIKAIRPILSLKFFFKLARSIIEGKVYF